MNKLEKFIDIAYDINDLHMEIADHLRRRFKGTAFSKDETESYFRLLMLAGVLSVAASIQLFMNKVDR